MRGPLVAASLGLLLAGCAGNPAPVSRNPADMAALQPEAEVRAAIEAELAKSAAAWDRGDIPSFLAIYSSETEPTFVASGKLLRGVEEMERRYRATYALKDPATRGLLTFDIRVFRQISPSYAHVITGYKLSYPGGETDTGVASLLFVREAAGWRIAADHSS